MHISQQIKDHLITDGWDDREQTNGDTLFYKRLPTGGQFGEAITTLRMDKTGRWFERVNGWGDVESEVDLRDHSDADAAVKAVLS